MPKYRVTERQIIRVDYIVDAVDENHARDMVSAMGAYDYDSFNTLEDSEIVLVMEERRPGIYGADCAMIDAFKAQWPAHGLPDELNCVVAAFDKRGNLVDLEGFNKDGEPLDTSEFAGPALAALVIDIQNDGYLAHPDKWENLP